MTDELADLADLLRHAAGGQEGVSADAVRDRLRRRGRRRRITYASLIAGVLVLAVVGLGAWPGPRPDVVELVGEPPTTVLPAPGDDPLVACDPLEGPWFEASMLDGVAGAESADGVANDVLRAHLAEYTDDSDPQSALYPQTGWIVVHRSDDLVVFVAPTSTAPNPFGISRSAYRSVEVGRFFNDWIVRGGGHCSPWIAPPAGLAFATWKIDPDQPPGPDDTEIHLEVSGFLGCGQAPLTRDVVVGPDVIETSTSVTIRMALDRPQQTSDESACLPGDPARTPLELSVSLRGPLADRVVVDGNRYRAGPVRMPDPPVPVAAHGPLVEFEGGIVALPVHVVADVLDGSCDDRPPSCLPSVASTMRFTVDGVTLEHETDADGWVTVVAPDHGLLVATAEAAGHWCSTRYWPTASIEPGPTETVGCIPLDPAAATVTGTVTDRVEPLPALVFGRAHSTMTVGTIAGEDGTYAVVLGPGYWTVDIASSFGGTTTCTPDGITIEPGEDQRIDFVCPYTQEAAERVLEWILSSQETGG